MIYVRLVTFSFLALVTAVVVKADDGKGDANPADQSWKMIFDQHAGQDEALSKREFDQAMNMIREVAVARVKQWSPRQRKHRHFPHTAEVAAKLKADQDGDRKVSADEFQEFFATAILVAEDTAVVHLDAYADLQKAYEDAPQIIRPAKPSCPISCALARKEQLEYVQKAKLKYQRRIREIK